MLHGPPLLAKRSLLPLIQPSRFGVEPCINFLLRAKLLVDITSFIDQIKHHPVFNGLVKLVGMDVASKNLKSGCRIFFQQGSSSKANKHRIGHERLHGSMKLAALRSMALINKDENITHCMARLRLKFPDELFKIIYPSSAELVNQRTKQTW